MEQDKPTEEENTLCYLITKGSKCLYNRICDNRIILSLLVIYLLFHPFFEKLINKSFVEAFFSSLEPTIINDIIFACLLVLVIIRTIFAWKNNQSISNKYLLISIIILLIIGYYRFLNGYWYYTSIKTFDFIKYVDIIPIYIILNLFISLLHVNNQINTTKEKGFCFDDPINDAEDDLLKRDSVAKNIADRIINTVKNESSFAIGITSEWGNGKTSFLNLIEKHLPQKDRVIIRFNPWLNNDEKTIVSTFFNELSIKLKDSSPKLSSDIIKYAEILSSVYSNDLSKLISTTLSLSNNDKSLRQQFDNVNNKIKKSGLSIVILVDDLDRLYENEVLEVLKLIRNSANFSNTIFVVAYDKNYVVTAIKKAINYHPDLYLEKIFQLEMALPAYEKSIIKKEIKKRLTPYLEDNDKTELKRILELKHNIVYGNYFDYSLLTNLRDISRFVNSFLISYKALKGECCLFDLLNLELFRIKYLGAYNLLAKNYNQFLTTAKNGTKNEYYLMLNKDENNKTRSDEQNNQSEQILYKNVGTEENQKTKFEKALNDNIGIERNQIEDILKYVYNIFPENYEIYSDHTIELLSIVNPISVNRYFHYNLLESDLSEIEFSKYRQKSLLEFKVKIKEWVDKGFEEELKRKFEYIEFYSDKDDYEKIIYGIFYLANLTPQNKDLGDYVWYDFINLNAKLDCNIAKSFYNEKQFSNFIIRLFISQDCPHFTFDFIRKAYLTKGENSNFILNESQLRKIILKNFTKYSLKTSKIDKYWFYNLFFSCINGEKNEEGEKRIVAAKNVFKACAKRLTKSFIESIISREYNPNTLYSIDKSSILKVWDTWENFESFINEIEESEWLIEFKDFYFKCKDVSFEGNIEYEFKELIITYV